MLKGQNQSQTFPKAHLIRHVSTASTPARNVLALVLALLLYRKMHVMLWDHQMCGVKRRMLVSPSNILGLKNCNPDEMLRMP